MSRRSSAILVTFVSLAGCGGMSPSGGVTSALVGPPTTDGGRCVLGQTVCNVSRSGLYTCVQNSDDPGDTSWVSGGACAVGCVTSEDPISHMQHDYCSACTASVQCVGTALQSCTAGQWHTVTDCAAQGPNEICNAATASCCSQPVCAANSCGTKTNACGSVECGDCDGDLVCLGNICKARVCHCPKGTFCDPEGGCVRF